MRSLITILLMVLLSGCALYTGYKDKPTPTPNQTTNAKTIQTPANQNNAGEKAGQAATNSTAKMMSPVVTTH